MLELRSSTLDSSTRKDPHIIELFSGCSSKHDTVIANQMEKARWLKHATLCKATQGNVLALRASPKLADTRPNQQRL